MADQGDVNVRISADTQALAGELSRGFGQITTQLQELQRQFGDLSRATRESSEAVRENSRNMTSGFEDLTRGLGDLQAGVTGLPDKFMMLGKALLTIAAGGAFTDLVKSYVEGTREVGLLAEKFNLTAGEADSLSDALKLSGKEVGDYIEAYKKLNEQLSSNAAEMQELGFSTEVLNSKTKDRTKLLEEGYRVMMQYAEGPDRDAAAMKIFGESADEAAKMFEKLNENKADAEALSKKFGQATIDEIASVREYERTMAQLSLVLEKFGEYIGGKLYPAVQEFADALLDQSNSAIPTFIDAIDKIFDVLGRVTGALVDFTSFLVDHFAPASEDAATDVGLTWNDFLTGLDGVLSGAKVVLLGLVGAFEIAWNAIKLIVRTAATSIAGQARFMERVMALDLSGAIEEWKRWSSSVVEDVSKTADEVAKKLAAIRGAQQAAAAGKDIAAPGPEKDTPFDMGRGGPEWGGGTKRFNVNAAGEDAAAKAQLGLAKATSEAKLQIAMAQLAAEEGELKRSLARREITTQQFLEREEELKRRALDLQIAAKQSELDQTLAAERRAKKEEERIALRATEAKLQADITKLEIQRADVAKDFAEQARKASEDSTRQLGDMRSQISALSGLGALNAQLDSIASKFRELPKEIANSAEAGQLQALQVVQAQIDETKRQFASLQGADDLRAVGAKDLYNRGLLTETALKRQLADITRQNADAEIAALNRQIDLLDQLGVGYDAQKAKLFEQRDALNRLKEGIDETAAQANESLRSSLEQAFIDVSNGKGLKGFGDAILNQVNGVFAKQFSNRIMGVLNGAGVGGSGGWLGNLLGTGGNKDGNEQAMAAAAQAATTSLQGMAKDGVERATGALVSQVAQQGATQSVSSMLNTAFQSLSQAAMAAASALTQVGGGSGGGALMGGGEGGGFGGFISSIFGSFGGFRANGGFAMGGTPYVVGENGPELFIPSTSGSVMSNDAMQGMGGGGGNVYMNISTPNADSFRKASQQTIVDYGRAMSRVQRRNG